MWAIFGEINALSPIAAAMATNPERSFPQILLKTSDLKAAYTFFRHAEATSDNLQLAHREVVIEQWHKTGG